MSYYCFLFLLLLLTNTFAYCESATDQKELTEERAHLSIPLGLPPVPWPADSPYDKKKAELGKLLYFDKRLSANGTISCATCHAAKVGFADSNPIAIGIDGHIGTRHSPTVINAAYQKSYFWDGRAKTLEEQAKGPLTNSKEMAGTDDVHAALVACQERIQKIPGYVRLFKEIFNDDVVTIDNLARAIATFERTILSGNAPYDRYMAGDKGAMTTQQVKGLALFNKLSCNNCHAGPNFTDGRFLNIGVGMEKANPDLGRYNITKDEKDWGAFKIPTLREVAHTAPYMHDGCFFTLREVIDYYDRGGNPNRNLHPLMKPLHMTEEDKQALLSFLEALNGEGWKQFTEPTRFPN